MNELLIVWTPAGVISAIAGGLGIGYFVIGQILRNPRYSSGQASPFESGRLVALAGAIVGATFYVGQTLSTLLEESGGVDLAWRVVSRFALWLLYSLCLGIGAAFAELRDDRERYLVARDRAQRQLGSKRR